MDASLASKEVHDISFHGFWHLIQVARNLKLLYYSASNESSLSTEIKTMEFVIEIRNFIEEEFYREEIFIVNGKISAIMEKNGKTNTCILLIKIELGIRKSFVC